MRTFPNPQSCVRLVRALAVKIHGTWLEATRYLNMAHIREHKKESLRHWPPEAAGAPAASLQGLRPHQSPLSHFAVGMDASLLRRHRNVPSLRC